MQTWKTKLWMSGVCLMYACTASHRSGLYVQFRFFSSKRLACFTILTLSLRVVLRGALQFYQISWVYWILLPFKVSLVCTWLYKYTFITRADWAWCSCWSRWLTLAKPPVCYTVFPACLFYFSLFYLLTLFPPVMTFNANGKRAERKSPEVHFCFPLLCSRRFLCQIQEKTREASPPYALLRTPLPSSHIL